MILKYWSQYITPIFLMISYQYQILVHTNLQVYWNISYQKSIYIYAILVGEQTCKHAHMFAMHGPWANKSQVAHTPFVYEYVYGTVRRVTHVSLLPISSGIWPCLRPPLFGHFAGAALWRCRVESATEIKCVHHRTIDTGAQGYCAHVVLRAGHNTTRTRETNKTHMQTRQCINKLHIRALHTLNALNPPN